jgi:hypothetical protein
VESVSDEAGSQHRTPSQVGARIVLRYDVGCILAAGLDMTRCKTRLRMVQGCQSIEENSGHYKSGSSHVVVKVVISSEEFTKRASSASLRYVATPAVDKER